MSSTKPTKHNDNQQSKGWVNIKPNNTSPNRRKRRRKRTNNKNTHKGISTKPKHAAPANASTIYCQWFQEGLCHRGNNCFFIHELDPLSEKNPLEHRQMIKELMSPNKNKKQSSTNIQIQLKKPPSQPIYNNTNDDGFLLPSQNTTFQQTMIPIKKYDRYSNFTPNQNNNYNHTQQHSFLSQNPYTSPPQQHKHGPPPNPYASPTKTPQNPINPNPVVSLNVNAMEFIPSMPQVNNTITYGYNTPYNPYLTAENAHTVNPYDLSSDFINKNKSTPDTSPQKLNANNELLNDPKTFNEDDYEIWEDENGEIIVVEKDQLYGDDPYYHDQKILKQYNKQRLHDNNNKMRSNMSQRGIRSGGDTYCYGGIPYNKNNNQISEQDCNISKVNDEKNNPDYDPKAKICRFWLNGKCAYAANCNMAHRFETNSCPHCGKKVGKSPLIQQQHLEQCVEKITMDEELKMSENVLCGICRENIMEKGSKFGLLTGCVHGFCLKCIREWRGVLHQSKEVVRACPICRQTTWFIVPCDRFITDDKRKEEIVNKYKKRLSEIKCKHFDENEECPFGTSCFYKHVRKDGSVDEKKLTLRHIINADGETEIVQQMRLSEFLFTSD